MSTPTQTTMARLKGTPKVIPNINTDLLPCQHGEKYGAVLLHEAKVLLTQDKAAWYIDLPEFEGERSLIEGHVQFLFDEMTKGNFNPALVILATCEYGGKTYKINGQHTCWAKFFLPTYTPEVREFRFRAETDEELRRLYSQFDRNKPRSESHLTKIHLAGIPELAEVPSDLVTRLNQGLRMWLFEAVRDNRRVRAEDVARLVKEKYLDLYRRVAALYAEVGGGNFRHLKRAPTLAAILATTDKAPAFARDFWMAVGSGEGLAKGDPRLALRNYLMTTGLSVKGGADVEIVGQEDMLRHCLVAWNKWRSKETLQVFRMTHDRPRIK